VQQVVGRSRAIARMCLLWAGVAVLSGTACGDDEPVRDGGSARDAEVEGPSERGADAGRRDAGGPQRDGAVDAGTARSDAGRADAGGAAAPDAAIADGGSAPVPSSASWLIDSGDSVFFVGNSFFGWGDRKLPEWVSAIGTVSSPKITINTGSHVVFGNQPLAWFFEQDESQDAIASGKYDIFVLQGEELEPVEHKEDFHNAVRDYHAAVTAKGGRLMLFMTWDFIWNKDDPQSQFFTKLSSAYDEIGRELDIPVIPVGLIYEDTNDDPYPGEQPYFLTGGDLHQTEKGSAVNAYATFAMLTGINPKGVPFVANGNTNSPELLRYLSDKSWARVSARLHD
jgi:hypothetical protein